MATALPVARRWCQTSGHLDKVQGRGSYTGTCQSGPRAARRRSGGLTRDYGLVTVAGDSRAVTAATAAAAARGLGRSD